MQENGVQSPSKEFREALLKEKLTKETAKTSKRDDEIADLVPERDALMNENVQFKNRNKKISLALKESNKESDNLVQFVEELRYELKTSQDKVHNFQEECSNLRSFIESSRGCGDHNASSFDHSFAFASNIINSTEYGCESLSESVTDIKLRESQKKNEMLEEKLRKIERDIESLTAHRTTRRTIQDNRDCCKVIVAQYWLSFFSECNST